MRLSLALALFSCVAADELEIYVRPNGVPLKEAATTFVGDSLNSLRKNVQNSFGKELGGKAWWFADSQGYAVTSTKALAAMPLAERQLTVVPAGKRFQWSGGKIGERFPVKLENWSGLELEPIAHSPKIFLMHNLFAEDEANFLIERAISMTGSNALIASGVGYEQGKGGKRSETSKRTSSSAFDKDSQVSKRLIQRAFEALRVPFDDDMADGLQILRYNEGQAYIPHTDWFPRQGPQDQENFDTTTPDGTNRLATVFLYLHPPPSGGYTVFPRAKVEPDLQDGVAVSSGRDESLRTRAVLHATSFYNQSSWEIQLTGDCFSQLAVKPVRLSASLFYHQEPMTGRLLQEALHGACPSLTGTKWGANLWVWNKPRQITGKAPPGGAKVPPGGAKPPPGGAKPPPGDASAPEQVEATFENREKFDTIVEYSLDGAQTWQHLDKLPPHMQFPMKTFSGHQWRFKGENGQELSRWVVPKGGGKILVTSDGKQISQMREDL